MRLSRTLYPVLVFLFAAALVIGIQARAARSPGATGFEQNHEQQKTE